MKSAEDVYAKTPRNGHDSKKDQEWADKYLTFQVVDEEYAVPVQQVREIISVGPVTQLPNLPAHMKGVLNLRGSVVPVVDMRIKYGLPVVDYTDRTSIVVLELEGESDKVLMGIVVDGVCDVARIKPQTIFAPPPCGDALVGDSVSGVSTEDGHVRVLIDIEKMLADDAYHGSNGLI